MTSNPTIHCIQLDTLVSPRLICGVSESKSARRASDLAYALLVRVEVFKETENGSKGELIAVFNGAPL